MQTKRGFLRWCGKEPTCQCRRCKRYKFDPWVGKIPWRRAWQPTLVFLPGEAHGHRSPVGTVHSVAESYVTKMTWHTHMTTTKRCFLLFSSTRMKSLASAVTDFNSPWRRSRWRSRIRQCSGKIRQNRPETDVFYESSFLHLLKPRKTLKLLTETSAPHEKPQTSKMYAWLHVNPLLKSHTYWAPTIPL